MQNLDSYFIEKGFFNEEAGRSYLEAHCENRHVSLRMSGRLPHLGILHYKNDAVFGKGAWTPFTKACRGVIVDFKNKKILTKPFWKFFNLNEKHAPSTRDLEKKSGFYAIEKIDGSMVEAYYDEVTDGFYMSTKGSLDSEQGVWATTRFPEQLKDKKLITSHTLIFEMICKRYQIVIPYDKKGYPEGLYLIGVRENKSEKLFEPPEVQAFAKEYKLPTFKTYDYPTLQSIIDGTEKLSFMEEGYVIRFKGEETMVKIKSPAYLQAHRVVSSLTDKSILETLIAGREAFLKEDLAIVAEEYREEVQTTLSNYKRSSLEFRKKCYSLFGDLPKESRKTFALEVKKLPARFQPFLFQIFEGKDPALQQIYISFKKWGTYDDFRTI